jgi:hypothetical protein
MRARARAIDNELKTEAGGQGKRVDGSGAGLKRNSQRRDGTRTHPKHLLSSVAHAHPRYVVAPAVRRCCSRCDDVINLSAAADQNYVEIVGLSTVGDVDADVAADRRRPSAEDGGGDDDDDRGRLSGDKLHAVGVSKTSLRQRRFGFLLE